ncbi:hypothetical protein [Priestia megaterium]|uniref:hypothetical protein n=1 Tax=Priestia megaterium TaxID=1404 RepID=UPI001155E664|nr:hypothetical protein [Priestia megaterium]
MKLFQKTAYIALATTSLMAACSETNAVDLSKTPEKAKLVDRNDEIEKKSTKDVENPEQEEWKHLNKGMLARYEGTTLVDTSSGEDENLSTLKVELEVKNIRSDGNSEDLSEVKYVIKNTETDKDFTGKAVPVSREEFENLSPNSTIAYNVIFKIDNIKNLNKCYLYIDSSFDSSSSIFWKLKKPMSTNN